MDLILVAHRDRYRAHTVNLRNRVAGVAVDSYICCCKTIYGVFLRKGDRRELDIGRAGQTALIVDGLELGFIVVVI